MAVTSNDMTKERSAALAESHGGTFMWSPRHLRTKEAAEAHKQRVIRSGCMYKLYMDGHLYPMGCEAFTLFAEPDDQAAIRRAFELADWRGDCQYVDDVPQYTYPFKLFNVNPNGTDRYVYDYKPKEERPKWEIYSLCVPDSPYIPIPTIYFYAKDADSAKKVAHHNARTTLLNFEGLQHTPEEYVPRPYQLCNEHGLVVNYVPSADIEINPQWLQTL